MPKDNPQNPAFPIPSGPELRAKGWRQEALLRLMENVLAWAKTPKTSSSTQRLAKLRAANLPTMPSSAH